MLKLWATAPIAEDDDFCVLADSAAVDCCKLLGPAVYIGCLCDSATAGQPDAVRIKVLCSSICPLCEGYNAETSVTSMWH